MIPGVRLIVLGRQGAGKGTQCVRLSRHYVVPHISTGDMLRSAVKEDTAFGRRAKEIMERGELVSDEIMIGIVDERLGKDDSRRRGFILDGFPRTVAQAEALIAITRDRPIDLVVDLEVPREVVLERLASRRVCIDCGANYSLQNRPARDWTCDYCGGDVVQRADDSKDAILRRLALYDEQTAPLHEFYAKRKELAMVDGVGSADIVLKRVIAVIEERRDRGVHA